MLYMNTTHNNGDKWTTGTPRYTVLHIVEIIHILICKNTFANFVLKCTLLLKCYWETTKRPNFVLVCACIVFVSTMTDNNVFKYNTLIHVYVYTISNPWYKWQCYLIWQNQLHSKQFPLFVGGTTLCISTICI